MEKPALSRTGLRTIRGSAAAGKVSFLGHRQEESLFPRLYQNQGSSARNRPQKRREEMLQEQFSPLPDEEGVSGLEDRLGWREMVDHQETSGISVSPGYALLRKAVMEEGIAVGLGNYRESVKREDEYASSLSEVLDWLKRGEQEALTYKVPEQNDEVEDEHFSIAEPSVLPPFWESANRYL